MYILLRKKPKTIILMAFLYKNETGEKNNIKQKKEP